jgi:gamma-glutamyltranspeptidase/glutathione hydrolase
VNYRGFEVRQTPPNSTGFVFLQALKLIEARLPQDCLLLSAGVAHTLIEAKKLAFVERKRYAGDPHELALPLEVLLDEHRLLELAERIDQQKSAVLPVQPTAGEGNTTYFCIVDKWGNAVSAIQSLNTCFGSAVALERTGILLNNRMSCWHLEGGTRTGWSRAGGLGTQ